MVTSTDMPPPVLFEKDGSGRIAIVTLNRPRVLNAYDTSMRDALYEVLCAVRDDPETRVMVLRGAGPAFSSGGDIRQFGTALSPSSARQVRWRRDVWGTLCSLSKITIAAVHGVAVGGGFEMAMLCDLCLLARDARLCLPETALGMIPGVAGTQSLPRLLGVGRAMDLVLTGQWLNAAQAKRFGLATRVVSTARLLPTAMALARRLANLDTDLVGRLKRAVREGFDQPLDRGLAQERLLAGMAGR